VNTLARLNPAASTAASDSALLGAFQRLMQNETEGLAEAHDGAATSITVRTIKDCALRLHRSRATFTQTARTPFGFNPLFLRNRGRIEVANARPYRHCCIKGPIRPPQWSHVHGSASQSYAHMVLAYRSSGSSETRQMI
jgi:hypothetical protein